MNIHRTLTSLVLFAFILSGCASTATRDESSESESTSALAPPTSPNTANSKPSPVSSNQPEIDSQKQSLLTANLAKRQAPERNIQELNQQIAVASMQASMSNTGNQPNRQEYRVGPGDVLEVSVFRIDDLNKTVRVTGDGFILLPLLGAIPVGGKTTQQIQALLVADLGENYLHDPQVSVFISEFKSHQVAVLGAVNSPDIYTIERPRTVMEMLSKAGGLVENAGSKIRVQRTIVQNGVHSPQLDVIDLKALLDGRGENLNFTLAAGDSVMVPEAGVVFVEGAVTKPGAYPLKSQTNVLKALAMAGGAKFEAKKGEIQIFRQNDSGETNVYEVDLKQIRSNQAQDISLEDGDIVVVLDDALKKGFAGFWRGFTGIFSVGTTL